MSKLSKEKRNNLILVVLVTVLVLGGLWFGLVSIQQDTLAAKARQKEEKKDELSKIEQAIRNEERLKRDLVEATERLSKIEEDMAPRDPLSWMVSKIDVFKLPYKVDMPQISSPETREMELLAKFPYKQATFGIGGTAYYHDLGKFLADFENHFPYFRIVNLDLTPAPMASEAEKEKLAFVMQLVTLVKPGAL